MKEIGIVTIREEDNYFLGQLLKDNIKEPITVRHFMHFPSGYEIDRNARTLLISGPYLENKVKELFPNSTIIVAERTFPTKNLEEIMLIPNGERTMVVNYPVVVVHNVINEMKRIGIDHIEFVPYDINKFQDYSDIKYAITFGLKDLCPKGIPHIIDVGKRAVSLRTFFRILEALELDVENANTYFTNFQNMMIKGNYRIAGLLKHEEDLSRNLEYICKTSNDGIICINSDNCVSILNWAARDILMLEPGLTGMKFEEALKAYPELISLIYEGKDSENIILDNFSEEKVVVNISFPQQSALAKAIIFVTKYNRIQRKESKIRHKIYKENKGLSAKYTFEDIIGESLSLTKVKEQARQFSVSNLNIMIEGESGTGKELFAQSIHSYSKRAKEPFVAINFAALPENLVESELFGYREGAFTGAIKGGKPGLFEIAHGGTIFLDEIGDASMPVQTKLLRVLEEREVMRIGSSEMTPVDVRVICATNKDLVKCIQEGTFRNDLYYRIKTLPLRIPSLNERKGDIPLLIESFGESYGLPTPLPEQALDLIEQYYWPGNIRELKSLIQYLSVILPSSHRADCSRIVLNVAEYFEKINVFPDNTSITLSNNETLMEDDYNYEIKIFILRNLLDARKFNKVIGRKRLLDLAEKNGYNTTEFKIRAALNDLLRRGLVRTGKTRQGNSITKKGITYLNKSI